MNESTDSTPTSGPRARASNLKRRLKEDGKQKIESGKRAAADQIAELADAIDVAGAQLDQSQPTLAGYATKLADGVGGLATRLREDNIEDLYREVRQLATRHPGMFLLGSAALGVVIARFMKASGDQSAAEDLGEVAESEGQEWGEATVDVGGVDVGDDEMEDPSRYRPAAAPDPYGSTRRGV